MEKYLLTLLNEKGIDLNDFFEIGDHIIEYGVVVDAILSAPSHEQKTIKWNLLKLDVLNRDVRDYFKRLAMALI